MTGTTLPKLVNAGDLAELFQVSKTTIFRWSRAGRIPPPVKVGKQFYWREGAVSKLFDDDQTTT